MMMSTKRAAAIFCMLGSGSSGGGSLPCAGFVIMPPAGLAGQQRGGATLVNTGDVRHHSAASSRASCRVRPVCGRRSGGVNDNIDTATAGLGRVGQRVGKRRLLQRLFTANAGGVGEGELGEGGPASSGEADPLPSIASSSSSTEAGAGVAEGDNWSHAQGAEDGTISSEQGEPSRDRGEDGLAAVSSPLNVGEAERGVEMGAAAAAAATTGGRHGGGNRRELPLVEREGFEVVKKALPKRWDKLVMNLEELREMRSKSNKLKRSMFAAATTGDPDKLKEIKAEVAALRKKDPLYVVRDAMSKAAVKEKMNRLAKLKAAYDWIVEESRGSVFDVDRLVCLSNKATNVITTYSDGTEVHRFLGIQEVHEISQSGQIQLPVWSPDGNMVAFTVLKAGSNGAPVESARIVVFRERGGKALDVEVPKPPFLLMWSPNSRTVCYLSNTDGKDGPTIKLTELLVKDATTARETKARGLAEGNPLFFAFTKKNTKKADMVVHTGSRSYLLDMATRKQKKLSTSAAPLFMAPSTHAAGGEDAVLLVEGDEAGGQHLVSVRVDGSAKKRLCPTRGFSTFSISPDERRVCLMQQDLTTGFYTISVLEGEDEALDPLSTATMEQVEIPLDRVMMGFFFSPDSKKILCLATKMSKSELAVARSSMRLGFQLKFQWVIYDCESRAVSMLEEFSPRQFFLKMYLPYFDMFAKGFTPWSPDSKSFTYVTADAAFVQEVPDEGLPPLPRQLGTNMEFVSWSFC